MVGTNRIPHALGFVKGFVCLNKQMGRAVRLGICRKPEAGGDLQVGHVFKLGALQSEPHPLAKLFRVLERCVAQNQTKLVSTVAIDRSFAKIFAEHAGKLNQAKIANLMTVEIIVCE